MIDVHFRMVPFQGACHVDFAQALENKEPRAATVKVTSTTAKTQLGRSSVLVEVVLEAVLFIPQKNGGEIMISLPLKRWCLQRKMPKKVQLYS